MNSNSEFMVQSMYKTVAHWLQKKNWIKNIEVLRLSAMENNMNPFFWQCKGFWIVKMHEQMVAA